MRFHQRAEYESTESPDRKIGIRHVKQYARIPFYDVNELLQEALSKRPELHAQESNEKAAKANLQTARSSIFPSISANAAATLNDTSWKHDTLYL